MKIGVIGLLLKSLADQPGCLVVPARLMTKDAKQMHRIGVTWVRLQQSAVMSFGRIQFTILMRTQGRLQLPVRFVSHRNRT